jgi:hypothetical protein
LDIVVSISSHSPGVIFAKTWGCYSTTKPNQEAKAAEITVKVASVSVH